MLGLVTLGTSPRKDFEDLFHEYVPGVELRLRGALDGLSDDDIDTLAAQPGDYPAFVGVNGVAREIELTLLQPLAAKQVKALAAEAEPPRWRNMRARAYSLRPWSISWLCWDGVQGTIRR